MTKTLNPRGCQFVCDTEDCIFWNEYDGCTKQTCVTIQEHCCCDYEKRGSEVDRPIDLDELLRKYFGSGFPLPQSPTCDSYEKLISLLNDVGGLTEISVEDLVETLDSISSYGAVYDCNGEMIYDEWQILEELEKREGEDWQ